jgi:preprotein translocase subunit SecE
VKPVLNYLSAARVELSKVVWPNRRQTIHLTLVVIAFSVLLAAVLGIMDYIFTTVLQKLIVKG